VDINAIKKMTEEDGIVFLTYAGFLSQTLIAGMTDALEREAEHGRLGMTESTNIYTIFIEMAQNIMNYAKVKHGEGSKNKPEGIIVVGKCDDQTCYYVQSQNTIDLQDKLKIQTKLEEISTLDVDGLKKRYRELRKSGRDSHEKGGGIGFYEIAKRCLRIEYDFLPADDDRFAFQFKAVIAVKKEDVLA
jgi:hypothetical protein